MKTSPALPLQQHPNFAAALRRMGRNVSFVDLDGAHRAVAVRVFGQALSSRAPIWHDTADQMTKATALARADLRLVNAETDDATALSAAGYRRLATPAWVAELHLTQPPAARLAATHGKWRNRWRQACEAPVTVAQERFDPHRHAWLLKADRAQQRQKRFRGLPHSLIASFAANHRDAACVFVAYKNDAPCAAMLFLAHHPVVTYHLGWISAAGRQWGLHHRILLDAAQVFAGRGFQRLDLGGVDTDNAAGLARFKIGSGAQVRTLGGTWLRTPRLRG